MNNGYIFTMAIIVNEAVSAELRVDLAIDVMHQLRKFEDNKVPVMDTIGRAFQLEKHPKYFFVILDEESTRDYLKDDPDRKRKDILNYIVVSEKKLREELL